MTQWFFCFETDSGSQNTVSHEVTNFFCNWWFVTKNSEALGRVIWQGITSQMPFFHVPGCFKFKFTFHNVFSFKWALILIFIWSQWFRGISKLKRNPRSLLATEYAKLGLVINWVKFNYTLTSKRDNLTFMCAAQFPCFLKNFRAKCSVFRHCWR